MASAASAMAAWQNFYVIVGSSAGALIGLQFVVMTLINDQKRPKSRDTLNAFGTPTVVTLSGALFVSALASVPWSSGSDPAMAFAACGIGGLVYGAIVVRRARRQAEYIPVWQDWVWYFALPATASAGIVCGAVLMSPTRTGPLFVIAASALALLFIGIHNAWDTVTHLVMMPLEAGASTDT